MTTNFPGSLDNFDDPTPVAKMKDGPTTHRQRHIDINDAIEAIELYLISALGLGNGADIGIGLNLALAKLHVLGRGIRLQFDGQPSIRMDGYSDVANEDPQWLITRNRGTLATPAAVQDGDELGQFIWRGFSGTGNRQSVAIRAEVDGTVTTSNVPGVLRIFIDDGIAAEEKVRITSNLDISNTKGALIVSRLTTTERDALTPVNGMIVYNTTTNAFNFYENGSWVTK